MFFSFLWINLIELEKETCAKQNLTPRTHANVNNYQAFYSEVSQLYFGFGLIEIYKSIIEIKKLNSTHEIQKSSFYSYLFFFYTKFRSYIESVYVDIVPWTASTPKIYDYFMTNAGKKVFLIEIHSQFLLTPFRHFALFLEYFVQYYFKFEFSFLFIFLFSHIS